MKNKKLIILFLITLAVILVAGITAKMQAPQKSLERTALFPELINRINDVSRIVVEGNQQTVELQQRDGNWVLASSGNYPALLNKVKAAVINMADLKIVDEKTDNPEFYARLGVEDPAAENAASLLITLFDESGGAIASLITGQPRQSAGSKPGLYVRKPDAKQALLVEGSLEISSRQIDWFPRELFDIPSAKVSSVRIQYQDGNTFEIFKDTPEQPDFQIRDEQTLQQSATKIILNRLGNGLQEIRADGVQPAPDFTFPEDAITTTVTTFDGLVINAKLTQIDDLAYANFSFTTDPEKTAADAKTADKDLPSDTGTKDQQVDINELAQTLNAVHSGWVYRIPDFKYEALTTSPDSLRNLLETMPEE